jgi:peptide-N4-(N-acetyl-beta-glucosaminyl)asparagine amidase
VWAEVYLEGSDKDKAWVHVDPCEAAIDEPLIYQSWGKTPTYIFSYSVYPNVEAEDVTRKYTTDVEGMESRRLKEGVNQSRIDELLAQASQLIYGIL